MLDCDREGKMGKSVSEMRRKEGATNGKRGVATDRVAEGVDVHDADVGRRDEHVLDERGD